jgi:tetratricopeptide (TPR) repeat protein
MISFRAVKLYLYLLVFLITFATFAPVMLNSFVNWDDYIFVVDNADISSLSWRSLHWMVTTFYQGVWHPLTWFSHAVDRALWGLQPAYHHLTSAVIHALNALLVFTLFVELTRGRGISEKGRYVAAFIGALLFAVHPLRVESVAWVSERKDVLCSFFFLSCMIFYLKYARTDAGVEVRSDHDAAPGLPPPLTPPARACPGLDPGGGDTNTLLPVGRTFQSAKNSRLESLLHIGKGGGEAHEKPRTPIVTPAKAGVQEILNSLDSGFRRNDVVGAPLAAPPPGQGKPCPYGGRERQARIYYVLALLFCFLALLSKPMAISLPLVVFLLDYYPLERLKRASWRGLLLEKLPFFVLSCATVVLNMLATRGLAVTFDYVSLHVRIMNALSGLLFYIKQTVFPDNLLPLYQMDRNLDYFSAPFILSALTAVVLTALSLWRAIKGQRLWAAVWFYYLITLAPAMGLFMSYRHAVADRYTYLPTLGFYLLAGLGAARLWDKAGAVKSRRAIRAAVVILVAVSALACGYKTARQIAVWRTSETMWRHVLDNAYHIPDLAFFGVGLEMEKQGKLDQAMELYEKAWSLNPQNPRFLLQMGSVMEMQGNWERALDIYAKLAKAYPRDPAFSFHQGRVLAVLGRDEEARVALDQALDLAPRESRQIALLRFLRSAPKGNALAKEYYGRYLTYGFPPVPALESKLGIESAPQPKQR